MRAKGEAVRQRQQKAAAGHQERKAASTPPERALGAANGDGKAAVGPAQACALDKEYSGDDHAGEHGAQHGTSAHGHGHKRHRHAKKSIISKEVKAIIRADIQRLPDVQMLITQNIHSLESLQTVLMSKIALSRKFLQDHLPDLPALQETMRAHPELSEWLNQKISDASHQVHITAEHLANIELPQSVIDLLPTMPDVRGAFSKWVSSMSELSADVQVAISENLNRLPDVQTLVSANLDRLPSLQGLVNDHYGYPLKSFFSKPVLKKFQFIPKWQQDNEFVLSGYRPEMLSFSRCIHSLTYLHNESMNIWTHLISGILFLALFAYVSSFVIHDQHWANRLTLYVFHGAAVVCTLSSAAFHTFFCHSHSVGTIFSQLDYFGIVALIVGSVYPVIYYAFYCHPTLAFSYILLTTAFGLICIYACFSPYFSHYKRKGTRVLLFVGLALTAIFPGAHLSYLYGLDHIAKTVDLEWLSASDAMYLIGAAVYAFKIPERLAPGKFDIWFHSHQIWHVCVAIAAYCHYEGVHNMLEYRIGHECSLEHTSFPTYFVNTTTSA